MTNIINPVIRSTEQLVLIVKQDLTFEGIYRYQRPRTWTGTIELERKEYATYADILHAADDKPEMIETVLRVSKDERGKVTVDDITDDVLDAAEGKPVMSCSEPALDFRGEVPALTTSLRPDMSRPAGKEMA